MEYSTFITTPDTVVPTKVPEDIDTPQILKMDDVRPEYLTAILNLPPNINLFSFPGAVPSTPMAATPKADALESPSFFSPSFADHLSTSNHRRPDPRIHTANIPLRLAQPIRSQTYPSTPSPVSMGPAPSSNYGSFSRSQASSRAARRASDIPPPNITPLTPAELAILLDGNNLLAIDIRAFAAYGKARLIDSINVCIPTVLLKRASLSLDDISESIVSRDDKGRFARWKEADGIVIYDSDSLRVKDAYPLATLATKFTEAGFTRGIYGLTGTVLIAKI
jgi:hypothetical protein